MKIFLIYVGLFIGLATNTANCQSEVKSQVVKYLVEQKDLGINQRIEDYTGSYYIVNLNNNSDYSPKVKTGIFRFGAFGDHAKTYLLAIDEKQIEIFDMSNLENCLSRIIKFIKKAKINSTIGLKYIENVLWVYRQNINYTPWKT